MQDRTKTWGKVGLLAGWAIVVLWNFFRKFPFINLLEILLNGATLLILLLFFTALGKRAFRYTKISFNSFAEECGFSFGLGTGLIIFSVIGLAALGLLYKLVVIFLVLSLFALVYKDAREICFRGYQEFLAAFSQKKSSINTVFLLFIGFAGLVTFFAAATPPYFYDALAYHLAVPQKYLLHHGFHYMPHHHFSNFPMNLGMIFIVGMSFSGGILAKLLSWVFAPMTVLAVYGFTKSRWGTQMALTAAAITFFVPGILILSVLTSVDLGVMFYSFLSFAALLYWFFSRQTSWLLLSGFFCSLAVGTKYTAIPLTFVPLEFILFFRECFGEKRSFRRGLRKTVMIGLIVLCGVAPWFIKNKLYTGNPVYPLFNAWFDTRVPQHTNYDNFISSQNLISRIVHPRDDTPMSKHLIELGLSWLKAPWTVTMKTSRVAGKTGALFLLCLPGIFLVDNSDRAIRYLLAIAACAFWGWVLIFPGDALRYVFLMFPPLSIVIAYILRNVPLSCRGRQVLLGGISLLLLYHLFLFFGVTNVVKPFSYLFGNLSKEEFLYQRGVGYYPAMEYINRETPEDSKILFVWDIRGYYCERDYLISTNTPYDTNAIILRQLILESQTAEEVIDKLHDLGITHLLVNFSEIRRFKGEALSQDLFFDFETEKDRKILHTVLSEQYARPVMSKYSVNVYEILYPQGYKH